MTITNSLVLTSADNAYGTIGVGLTPSGTSLTWTTGHGARFPAVASGQVLYACILNATNVLEEIQITAHTNGADTATIVRGVNGTSALTWNAGDRIECRVSSEVLRRAQQEALNETIITTGDGGATYTGSPSPTLLGYVKGVVYALTLSATQSNSGTTPTIALSGLTATTVVVNGQAPLVAGQMPIAGLYKYDGTYLVLLNPAKNIQPTRTVLTSGSAATYTTPTGATGILVRVIGGGAAGGGAAATGGAQTSTGSGGGGGGYSEKLIIAPAATYTYTVGASAAGSAGGNGTAGNDSSFSTLTAHGGGAGIALATGAPPQVAGVGAGGTATGGDVNVTGQAGGYAVAIAVGVGIGGPGGSSLWGLGGALLANGVGGTAAGLAGGNYGGGGSGAANDQLMAGTKAGGAGAAGIIIVDEWYN